MIKEVLENMDVWILSRTSLMMFLMVFVGVVLYAWTRSARQVERWARIPLEAGDEPTERRSDEGRSL
jgi:hypothetical protein